MPAAPSRHTFWGHGVHRYRLRRDAWPVLSLAERIEVDGVLVPVADKRSLIKTKMTIRPQDAADRAFLEARIAEEEAQG